MAKTSKGTLEVAGKSFTFEPDTESELEAYTAARLYLDTKHQERIAAIAPAPGSQHRAPRDYDGGNDVTHDTAVGTVLTPPAARLKKRGAN
jgi:hypothetical protein